MKEYHFTLFVDSSDIVNEDFIQRLLETGVQDMTPGISNGRADISCHVEADSLEEAIRACVAALKEADPLARVLSLSVEGEELTTIVEAG
ncbi:hypothetical protein [Stratiformator vulcanicus]|uniref:Uncharacterized protein n=1 Tax=Stratiformator vulcanicus TaxID=2527980 RepID=A0A517QYF4_9PLAN|nr:hypothetical protein [Stratiformator vulcanicus]QDT36687.1 hypothetical protein Pan189_10490 [Stratiformator vulcanicus]